ncbi:MAG: hypothetical protein P8Q26_00025 [Ascidiaceihabitans sp.]|nr:hypothetical protein [Ascidiaceihabitans sp.]
MLKSYIILPWALTVTVAGCGYSPVTKSNGDASLSLMSQSTEAPLNASDHAAEMQEQAATLDPMMQDVVRASTAKGAMMGAAVGCGLVLLSANNSAKCLAGAAAGGLAGGVVGNNAGKRDATRRIGLVSANKLTMNIRRSNDQVDDIMISLRDTLASQEIELANLRIQRDAGKIAAATYDAHVQTVMRDRAELAHALTLSAGKAQLATKHLQEASTRGQTGLDWHISATSQLERDIESARSQISLL